MYSCKDVNQLLTDYLENKLPEDVRKQTEYHLSLCPNCVKYINTYKKKMPPELEKTLLRVLAEKK
jgi:anti-sigma factor RsiW